MAKLVSAILVLGSLIGLSQRNSTSSSDIGAKLNAEFGACAGRCTVRVPAGRYSYSTDIVMSKPATLECDSAAVLDYKGTGYAMKVGPDGLTVKNYSPDPYVINGCTFTGGETMTEGIYVNEFVVKSVISNNYFHNFGNAKAFDIWFQGQNWDERVLNNYMWADSGQTFTYNGIAQNAADPANTGSGDFGQSQLFLLNNHLQNIARHKDGVGVYVNGANGQLIDNVVTGFAPNIQLGSQANHSQLRNLTMERPTQGSAPCISFGDTSGPRIGSYLDGITISDSTCNVHNTDFGTTAHFFGPSTAQSGIQNVRLVNNVIVSASDAEPITTMNDLPSQLGNYATLNRIGKSIPLTDSPGRLHSKGIKIGRWAGTDESPAAK